MGLLTLIRRSHRHRYRVRAHGLGRFSEERFATLVDARMYANELAKSGCICLIYVDKDPKPVYCTDDDGDDGYGLPGVREPLRPMPGSSAGSISLELPD